MNKNIAILITAFNESVTLKELLPKIDNIYDVWVVDDGSTDNTADIVRSNRAKLIQLSFNIGQGAAAITGYKLLSEKKYDYIIKMDGDGQHDPEEIGRIVDALRAGNVDMVIGSRVLGTYSKDAPLIRRIMLKPLTMLINRLTGYNLTDSMSGFRGFTQESLKRLIPIFNCVRETEYLASEMLLRFSMAGIKVHEIPINMKQRKHGWSYKGLVRYGLGVLQAIISTKLDMTRK